MWKAQTRGQWTDTCKEEQLARWSGCRAVRGSLVSDHVCLIWDLPFFLDFIVWAFNGCVKQCAMFPPSTDGFEP